MNRKFVLKNVLALGMVMVGLSSAVAQTTQAYPVNRVTLVTHSSPGGGSDVFLRDLAKYIPPIMKTNLAVENIRGGSGAKAVARCFMAQRPLTFKPRCCLSLLWATTA